MFRCIEPQDGPAELAPHPHKLTLQGRATSISFPPVCPHCGSAATETIAFSKVFRNADDDTTRHVVERIRVPFCDACIERHRAQVVQPSWFEMLRSSFASMDMLGAVFPAMGAMFVLNLALGDAVHGQASRCMVELAIAAVFALIAWLQGHSVWQDSERYRVSPQTDVTLAFDFSDDTSAVFEKSRFVCTMRHARFANAFRILNAQREWHPYSASAIAERQRSNRLTWLLGFGIGAIALWDMLHGLVS